MTSSLLITGGLGYIGSHTVFELIGCGHEVVILDSLFNSCESVLGGIQKITGKNLKLISVTFVIVIGHHNINAMLK